MNLHGRTFFFTTSLIKNYQFGLMEWYLQNLIFCIFAEAVAGVVGRADIGAAFFFITSLILYQNSTNSVNNHNDVTPYLDDVSHPRMIFVLSQLSAFCSTFTKEQGVTVLGVLVVCELLFVSRCNLAYPLETFKRVSILRNVYFFLLWVSTVISTVSTRFRKEENSYLRFWWYGAYRMLWLSIWCKIQHFHFHSLIQIFIHLFAFSFTYSIFSFTYSIFSFIVFHFFIQHFNFHSVVSFSFTC